MGNIKDYLHFYIGCDVMHTDGDSKYNGIFTIVTVTDESEIGRHYRMQSQKHSGVIFGFDSKYDKPILREFQSLTETELQELEESKASVKATPVHQIYIKIYTAESYRLLFKWGIDIFGLIESGLAIKSSQL